MLDSFNTLVTVLEANEEVVKMEIVTERILHAERKQKEKLNSDTSGEKAMTTRQQFNRRVQSAINVENMVTSKRTVELHQQKLIGASLSEPHTGR